MDGPLCFVELHEGPRFGGPLCVLDPGGGIRTRICRMDGPPLCQLSYPGVVLEHVAVDMRPDKSSVADLSNTVAASGDGAVAWASARE